MRSGLPGAMSNRPVILKVIQLKTQNSKLFPVHTIGTSKKVEWQRSGSIAIRCRVPPVQR